MAQHYILEDRTLVDYLLPQKNELPVAILILIISQSVQTCHQWLLNIFLLNTFYLTPTVDFLRIIQNNANMNIYIYKSKG
jgi:hypothetical protein